MCLKLIVDVDECSGRPCQNGASCSMPKFDMYSCQCAAGYSGTNCETGNYVLQKMIALFVSHIFIKLNYLNRK